MEKVEKLDKKKTDFCLLDLDPSSFIQATDNGILLEEVGIESSSPCPSVVVAIQEELRRLSKLCPQEQRCIYRVPKRLRGVKEEAYMPIVVSIGPFHHNINDERLLPMETLKLRLLHSFIHRSERKGRGDLNTYFEMVKGKESQIRDSYAEHIPMSSDEFVRMVLVDSIFIIQLFCSEWRTDIMPTVIYNDMEYDLRLAENQLHFFILVDLYTAAFKQDFEESFTYIACRTLDVDKSRVEVDPITKEATTCFHLLDLVRSHYLPSHPKIGTYNRDDNEDKWQKRIQVRCCYLLNFLKTHYLPYHQNANTATEPEEIGTGSIWCPTAMSLHDAGVKFRVSKKKPPCSLLDIHFDEEKGILTVPPFRVEDHTECLHKNLIAFEQCQYFGDQTTYIGDYFTFMNCLINTWEDVNLLVEAGIIDNWLGSEEEVAHLLNSLNTNIYTISSEYYYSTIMKQLNNHRKKRWNRYRAILKHTYFKHPWAVLSVIYAVILLLLTTTRKRGMGDKNKGQGRQIYFCRLKWTLNDKTPLNNIFYDKIQSLWSIDLL